MEVLQRFDAIELRVLARITPTVDLTTLQAAMVSLREDIDAVLEPQVPESEAPSVKPVGDTVMDALFSTTTTSSP